ncbi:MAG TPA: hypothetical protein VIE68_13445 [Gemmatimonadota bacterium]
MRAELEEARQREAAGLDSEILEAIGRGWDDPLGDAAFDRLARDVFAHQFRFNPVYRQFCLLQGVSAPADVDDWRRIPFVPTGAFKVGRWATFPEDRERVAFRTSGTTGPAPGVHRFETLALYNAAIVSSARRWLVPDRDRIRCLFLSPEPREAPGSSLVHMFAVFREALGAPGTMFLRAGGESAHGASVLTAAIERMTRDDGPLLIAGAALAFHHALAGIEADRTLPTGSRVMVTGGFKGRRVSIDAESLAETIERRLGVARDFQSSEYGMTELSTQYYDARLRRALGADGSEPGPGFVVPPWARVRIIEPTDGQEVGDGVEGAIVHYDLANRGSAIALQTSDLGARTGPSAFELRGREPGAEARGCSLAADLWLGGA